jgi:hypothetical protein
MQCTTINRLTPTPTLLIACQHFDPIPKSLSKYSSNYNFRPRMSLRWHISADDVGKTALLNRGEHKLMLHAGVRRVRYEYYILKRKNAQKYFKIYLNGQVFVENGWMKRRLYCSILQSTLG